MSEQNADDSNLQETETTAESREHNSNNTLLLDTSEKKDDKQKVDILLKPTGNAPIMKKKKWAVDADKQIGWIMEFIKKYLKLEPEEKLFLYVNQTFAPSPDQTVRNLYNCYSTEVSRITATVGGTGYCEWNYNGLGIDYQILAGPSFIAVFTIIGVFLGVAADKYNRVRLLAICSFIIAIAVILTGSVQEYWQLVLLRMVLAFGEAGCNPMATGILSDIFPEEKRGLVMSIFNWGIYGGYGIAFPVGRYVTKLNFGDLGWRVCYYGAGVIALFIAFLTAFTLREPERQTIGEENNTSADAKKVTIWNVILQPRVIMLCLAASIRHCGGMCFAYNCDLYYQQYFPDYDLGWALFAVTIVIGSIGVVVGGVVSDKFVAKMGIRSRVAVLAISQLIATPFAFGSVFFNPLWAMITLGISYFFAEMWFGIVFAILVEIVPLAVRSTTVGVFLFVMNNIGGNLPILVDPVSKAVGYRESLYIFYAGFYGISSIMFFLTIFLMDGPVTSAAPKDTGHENGICTTADEIPMPAITNGKSNGGRLPSEMSKL